MLLNNEYTIVPSLRLTLTYDNDVRRVITVKTRDTIDCSYKKNGELFNIIGVVTKIGCNFNSSLGSVGTTAYLQVDGSSEYAGQVEYIQPNQIYNLNILCTTDTIENVVCSVDNETQRIMLIRENEVGVAQYSIDGLNWRPFGGTQGMSAYEVAVKLGFKGTEEEWLKSLVGKQGEPGEAGALGIYKVYDTKEEAESDRINVPKGKLVAVTNGDTLDTDTMLFVRDGADEPSPCPVCGQYPETNVEYDTIIGYIYLGYLTVGPAGPCGPTGKSAYQYAVEGGYPGSEDDFKRELARTSIVVTRRYEGISSSRLDNTVVGPIDLRIYGHTNTNTFRSAYLRQIDISSPYESDDQTLVFSNSVVLRAVRTKNPATKPNLVVDGKSYVADCVMTKNGQIGVNRRIGYIESYAGEAIVSDWISSTGGLDMGAHVQFIICENNFEPFDEEIQKRYKLLRTYDGATDISILDTSCHVSVDYPVDVFNYIDQKLSSINSYTVPKDFVATRTVGGVAVGTPIHAGMEVYSLMKIMLCPEDYIEEQCIYWGTSSSIPESVDGLSMEIVKDSDLKENGISRKFTSDDDYFVFAYKKSIGDLVSIKDPNGFENIDGWTCTEVTKGDLEFYVYYTNESLTVENFKMTFKFTEE